MIPQAAVLAIRHRKILFRVLIAVATAVTASALLVAVLLVALVGGAPPDAAAAPLAPGGNYGCVLPPGALPSTVTVPGLTPTQNVEATTDMAVAVSVGKGLGLPAAAWKVAIMTMLVESNALNLNHGDRDSLGLYQQRPSTGWGTPAQIMDPTLSTLAFYGKATHTHNTGLTEVPNWQTRALTDAGGLAQAVQRSAFPSAYAAKEGFAAAAVAALSGVTAGLCAPTNPGGPTGPWTLPMVSGTFVITSDYGMRVNPVSGLLDLHGGTDFSGPCGTPEVAASAGTVVHAGPGIAWAGNYVVIDHGAGITTWYAHQQQTTTTVGATVAPGAPIGLEGTTGNSTGCHLHFETRVNDQPVPTRPFMAAHGVTIPAVGGH